jgi:hypothetical protein
MARRSRWIAAATAAVVLAAGVLAWWLLRSDPGVESASDPEPSATTSTMTAPAAVEPVPGPCDEPATKPFTPERVTIDGVVEDGPVVGVARDSRGVTGVLPTSNKVDFAWDLGGIRPGSRRGNVLLNTHTWPVGTQGEYPALGNALLGELDVGDRLALHGSGGARLCYRVFMRIEVLASDGYPPYYEEDGPPRVAIIVCSGTRSSDGEWSHRTIWFARPLI